jgi:hypothetical protein
VTSSIRLLKVLGSEAKGNGDLAPTAADLILKKMGLPLSDLAEAHLPYMCKEKLIVLDDCERVATSLSVNHLFGFINHFVQEHGCRFLLLQNADEIQERERWNVLREKIIDRELILDSTSNEAFAIAVGSGPQDYKDAIGNAIKVCAITNIRVIRLIIRDINYLLENHRGLSIQIQNRIIPSLVLFAGTFYRAIDHAATHECIDTWFDGKAALMLSAVERAESAALEDASDKLRDPLLQKLGIVYFDEFEHACARYFKVGLRDSQKIEACIAHYQSNVRMIQAEIESQNLIERLKFDWRLSFYDKKTFAESMVAHCQFLSGDNVSYLASQVSGYDGLIDISESYIDTWVDSAKAASGVGYSLGLSPNRAKIHPKILRWNASHLQGLREPTVVETLFNRIDKGDTPNLEELNKFTSDDFQIAFKSVSWERSRVLFDWLFGIVRNSRGKQPIGAVYLVVAGRILLAVRDIAADSTGNFVELSKMLNKYAKDATYSGD